MNPMTNEAQALSSAAVEMELRIEAPRAEVWRIFCEETAAWWLPAMRVTPGSRAVQIEAWAGGRILEEGADGSSLLWGHVQYIQPPHVMHWQAQISPPWGGPATMLIRFAFEEDGAEATILKVSDHVFGADIDSLAQSKEAGWRLLLEEGFKTYVEQNASPASAS